MPGFDIGISGINAAQKALEVVGNNIANAGTDGYHKQRANLTPAEDVFYNGSLIGQGVEARDVQRLYSVLVEQELLKQNSSLSYSAKQVDTLQVIENSFGELISDGLSTAMDNYFESLNELSTEPNQVVLQNKVLRCAESLTYEFRRLGNFLAGLQDDLVRDAQNSINQVNIIAKQIGKLNNDIQTMEMSGQTAANLRDERDKLLTDLSQLVDFQTYESNGTVNVVVGQNPIVVGSIATELKCEIYNENGQFKVGVAPVGTSAYSESITGGKVGAVFSMHNDYVHELSEKLDALAQTIIYDTNKIHVQGIGSDGAFDNLAGWVMVGEDLHAFEPAITQGTIAVRVTDPSGDTQRYYVDVDPDVDTLSDVVAKFNAISGFQGCGLIAGKVVLQTQPGYTFDFQGGVPPHVTSTGAPAYYPEVSGIYTGDLNQTFTCKVITGGQIGLAGPQVQVFNEAGGLVGTMDLGNGYYGQKLYVDDGFSISFPAGSVLTAGDEYEIETLCNSDTSGFLAASGINCFFSGFNASTMSLRSDVAEYPGRLALAAGGEKMDGEVVRKMANIGDAKSQALNNLSPEQFYQNLASDIGQELSGAKMRMENANNNIAHLAQQRDDISGVDINVEATNLMVYQRMFQSMAKYINTVSSTLESIMSIIR